MRHFVHQIQCALGPFGVIDYSSTSAISEFSELFYQ
jgi:hypothetical protein